MSVTRLLIGLAAVAIALWVLVGEQLAGVSADAVVNARLVSIRAPVAGRLTLQPLTLGARVRIGDDIGSVQDPRSDAVRLDDLVMEEALATAAVTRANADLAATEAEIPRMAERTRIYHEERRAELQARLDLLRGQGAQTGTAPVDQGVADLSTTPVPTQGERIRILEIALEAEARGVFLGDGYNDAPWSEQHLSDLNQTEAAQKAALAEAQARQAAIAARVDAEHLRVNLASNATLTSPVDGIFWELRSAGGEDVQRGDELLKLIDCSSTFVTLSVTQSIYNSLKIGDPARFRPDGQNTVFDGTVTRLAGSGAETIYRNLAVAATAKHLERYDVAIDVPGLAGDDRLGCAVGRTGRVFFQARPLDWLRSWVQGWVRG
ncbi:HlyD family efflux transporter periplasmic adaptor subunit [bacterium]|nr:HlyD family efflux transporter periplasmic adaptor subunit [bacterium]